MLRILEKRLCQTESRKPKGERNTLYRICLESKFLHVATRSFEWIDFIDKIFMNGIPELTCDWFENEMPITLNLPLERWGGSIDKGKHRWVEHRKLFGQFTLDNNFGGKRNIMSPSQPGWKWVYSIYRNNACSSWIFRVGKWKLCVATTHQIFYLRKPMTSLAVPSHLWLGIQRYPRKSC